jgi:tetratricopeptide (TPR) repeat protein
VYSSKQEKNMIRRTIAQSIKINRAQYASTTRRHYASWWNRFLGQQSPKQHSSPLEYQSQIDKALNEGNIEQVHSKLLTFERGVARESDQWLHFELYKNRVLATVSYQQLDYVTALKYCDNALSLENDLVTRNLFDSSFINFSYVILLKCDVLIEQMEYEQSLSLLTNLIDTIKKRISEEKSDNKKTILFDTLSLVLYRRAKVLMFVNRIHEALLDIDESVSINPQAFNLLLKGEIHFRKSEISEAVKIAQRIYDMEVDDHSTMQALKILAKSLAATEKYEQCVEVCDSILKTDHHDAFTYILRAECHSHLHRYNEVIEDCKRAEQEDPTQIFSILELHANALNRLARYNELIEHIEHLHRIIKDLDVPSELVASTSITKQLAKVDQHCWNGEYKEALDILQNKVPKIENHTMGSMHITILSRMVKVLLLCGRNEEALKAAEEYVQSGDKMWFDQVDSLELRALANSKLGNMEAALKDLETADEIIENTEDTHVNLKEEMIANHKYTKAQVLRMDDSKKQECLQLFNDALEYTTRNQLLDMKLPILADLGLLENELEMSVEGMDHLRQVLEHIPDHKVYSQWKF